MQTFACHEEEDFVDVFREAFWDCEYVASASSVEDSPFALNISMMLTYAAPTPKMKMCVALLSLAHIQCFGLQKTWDYSLNIVLPEICRQSQCFFGSCFFGVRVCVVKIILTQVSV